MRAEEIRIIVDPALSDDPIFTADIRTPFGTLDVMAKVDVAERTLVLEGLHIGGDPARTWRAASLLRRHLSPKAAHALMTELFDSGQAYAEIPKVEDFGTLRAELAECGVEARRHRPEPISVRQVRETLGLSQMQFALRFGLEEATVRNWEQGRSRPNATALTLLWTILRHPEAVTLSIDRDGETVAEAAPL